MNDMFPGRCNIAVRDSNKGDKETKTRWTPKLAPDESEIANELKALNKFDLELFEFAKDLLAKRLKFVPSIVQEVTNTTLQDSFSKDHSGNIENVCGHYHIKPSGQFDKQIHTYFLHLKMANRYAACDQSIRSNEYKRSYMDPRYRLGVVQPPGHKGPF
jgi:hypothetical protein